jgi:hypothetical protein
MLLFLLALIAPVNPSALAILAMLTRLSAPAGGFFADYGPFIKKL